MIVDKGNTKDDPGSPRKTGRERGKEVEPSTEDRWDSRPKRPFSDSEGCFSTLRSLGAAGPPLGLNNRFRGPCNWPRNVSTGIHTPVRGRLLHNGLVPDYRETPLFRFHPKYAPPCPRDPSHLFMLTRISLNEPKKLLCNPLEKCAFRSQKRERFAQVESHHISEIAKVPDSSSVISRIFKGS